MNLGTGNKEYECDQNILYTLKLQKPREEGEI